MQNANTKKLLGAVVAAVLAIAVYYGLVGQQQAGKIQNQADQTLGTAPAQQQTTNTQNVPAQQSAQAPQPTPSAQAPQTSPTSQAPNSTTAAPNTSATQQPAPPPRP